MPEGYAIPTNEHSETEPSPTHSDNDTKGAPVSYETYEEDEEEWEENNDIDEDEDEEESEGYMMPAHEYSETEPSLTHCDNDTEGALLPFCSDKEDEGEGEGEDEDEDEDDDDKEDEQEGEENNDVDEDEDDDEASEEYAMPAHEHSETEPSPTHSDNDTKGALVPYCSDKEDEQEGEENNDFDEDDDEEYVVVNLAAIREEMQCPICLGIIRKTRTVMECLHRFCRDCIDKSMRLGNNECPACRTHCASRRSLRDDPNYDALIAAIYPDLDKYEAEEMALHEEEEDRNRQIQASIADTFRRQSEAMTRRRRTAKATAAAFVRKAHGKFCGVQGQSRVNNRVKNRSKRPRRSSTTDGDEGEDLKQSFSDDEEPQPRRWTRRKRRAGSSLPETSADMDVGNGEEPDEINDEEAGENSQAEFSRESNDASPGNARNAEGLAWGKGGARSHVKSASGRGTHAKNNRSAYIAKMADYLLSKAHQEMETEYDIHFTLLPFENEEKLPSLRRPHLCCRPTLTVEHICKFLSRFCSVPPEDLELIVEKQNNSASLGQNGKILQHPGKLGKGKAVLGVSDSEKLAEVLNQEATLAEIFAACTECRGNLVLMYRCKDWPRKCKEESN